MKTCFAAFLCLCGLAARPAAAQVSISAQVSQTDVAIDDQIALSVTVSGPDASLPEPKLPALSNLSIYDSGRSQNLSIVNGQVSSSIVYTYVVIPRAVGKAVIPPISVTDHGRTFRTEAITLNVHRPQAGMTGAAAMPRRAARRPQPPQGGQGQPDAFVAAQVDDQKPFVNQQLTLTVRFYTAVSLLQSPQYQPPQTEGFICEDLPPERHGQATIHGRAYYYSEIKTALFATQPGPLTIAPASVRALLPQAMPVDPFSGDFFNRFFQQGLSGGRVLELRSKPITVDVQPLPKTGKPRDFSGAVGRFSISDDIDHARLKTGEAATLTVTVSGEGNLKSIAAPALPQIAQLQAFETVSSLSFDKKNDVLRGSKSFKTVLVPRVSGRATIPPVHFSYFDPVRRAYVEARTSPIALDIAPGAAAAAAAGPAPSSPRSVAAVSSDLRYLKTAPLRGKTTRFLQAMAAAGPLNAMPFVVFLGALGLSLYRRQALLDPAGTRSRGALRVAQARLRQAEAASEAAAAAHLSDALTGYLADKLGRSAHGLTAKRVQELARARRPDAPGPLIEEIRTLWEELDMRRFSPSSGHHDLEELADRLDALLRRLEREVFS
ncbi:MAG: protein BatD [Elusimicrobia bacterium]|nr:protein BatD [Elusimicrobiota bacterium]